MIIPFCGEHSGAFAAVFARQRLSKKTVKIQDDNVIKEYCDSRGVNKVL